jgi:hypothetical protein
MGSRGNKLLLVITDPKPEELTADKEDDKSKTFVIDRRQFKQDYVGYLDRYSICIPLFLATVFLHNLLGAIMMIAILCGTRWKTYCFC